MKRTALNIAAALIIALMFSPMAFAHCDTEIGPVIQDAKKALDDGNVNRVLIWVDKKDENIIKEAFNKAIKSRKANQEEADMAFFETLVEVHRASEGAGYDGIKDGADVPQPLKLIDASLETRSESPVINKITENINKVLTEKYEALLEAKNYDVNDVEAGRLYVDKYVEFMHLVENLHATMNNGGVHHATPAKADCGGHGEKAQKNCGHHK